MKTKPILLTLASAIATAVSTSGCGGAHTESYLPPGPVLPPAQAAALVNENSAKINGTLRAVGTVDGHFRTEKGRRVSYHVDGTLFYLPPQYLRFDLKKLGNREFLFGSNNDSYWAYSNTDDDYYCGRHGMEESLPSGEAIQAAQVIDALGLSPIPAGVAGSRDGVELASNEEHSTRDMQMIRDTSHGGDAVRVYWLDRRPPRLIRRIELHDRTGRVVMQSDLADYRQAYAGGPYVPYLVEARWPGESADLRFQVGRWTTENEVSGSSPQFATPKECTEKNH